MSELQRCHVIHANFATGIRRGCSPPGTGGVDAPSIKCREASFEKARTGWSVAELSSQLTTPSALLKVASRNFLTRAATPPVPGGEHPHLIFTPRFLRS